MSTAPLLEQSRADRAILLQACLAALLVRAFMFWFVDPRFEVGDAASYLIAARNIINVGTFSYDIAEPFAPTAYRAPLYPAYLAALLAIARDNLTIVRCLQVVVSLLNVVMVARIASKVAPRARSLAVWLAALNPFDAVYSTTFLSESISSTLLLAAVTSLTCLRGIKALALSGVFLGLLCLAKDVYLPLVPFGAVLWLAFRKSEPMRERFRQAAIVSVVAGLVVIPYTLRNAHHFGRFIPVSAGRLGQSLWMASWAVTGADLAVPTNGLHYIEKAYQSPDEIAEVEAAANGIPNSDHAYRKLFNARMKNEPAKVIGRWLLRVPMLWLGTRFDIFQLHEPLLARGSRLWTLSKLTLFGLNAVLTLAALLGIIWAIRSKSPALWLVVPILATAIIFFPLNGFENRYSMPVYDLLILFAAMGAGWLLEFRRSRQRS